MVNNSRVNVNLMRASLPMVILFCELARMLVLAYVSALQFFLFYPFLLFSFSFFRGFFSLCFWRGFFFLCLFCGCLLCWCFFGNWSFFFFCWSCFLGGRFLCGYGASSVTSSAGACSFATSGAASSSTGVTSTGFFCFYLGWSFFSFLCWFSFWFFWLLLVSQLLSFFQECSLRHLSSRLRFRISTFDG